MKNKKYLPGRACFYQAVGTLLFLGSLSMGCVDNQYVEVLPTLDSIQEHVFDQSCLGCHTHGSAIHGIELSEGFSLDNMLYVQSFMEPEYNLIEAGDPDNSLLIQKLRGTSKTAYMPMLAPLLPSNRVEAVAQWIANMEPTPQPTLIYFQKNVFDSCATSGCHDNATQAQGLDLSAGNSLASMFGVPSSEQPLLDLIEPGDPDNSYLVDKVTGAHGQPRLTQTQINALKGWVATLEGPQPTLEWLQENVFDVSCAYSGCHDGDAINAGEARLTMTKGFTVAETVNIRSIQNLELDLIVPGDADASYLMKKMKNIDLAFGSGSMPWLSPVLSQDKLDAVETWINNMSVAATPSLPDASLASIQSNVFDVSCATEGCHDSLTASFGLDLSSIRNSYASLMSLSSQQQPALKLIEPGDANASYLIKKMAGTGSGKTMPIGQSRVSSEIINVIAQWINTVEAEPMVGNIPVSTYFSQSCASCHGADREGGIGPALTPADLIQPDAYYFNIIKNSLQGLLMPAFSSSLSDAEIDLVINYLHTEPVVWE